MPSQLTGRQVHQLRSSSTVGFARSVFHGAEAKQLFDQQLVFPSAVSAYYSLFHLGSAMLLAYWLYPQPQKDPYSSLRKDLEKKWTQLASRNMSYSPDPAQCVRHSHLPKFLPNELPELAKSIGESDVQGALMDMREFASYAPRLRNERGVNIL